MTTPEPATDSKTTPLIESIIIREYQSQQERVRARERAVALHTSEVEYWHRTLEALRASASE